MIETSFAAHTALVIDLGAEGMPISTLGLKITDAHVTEAGELYMLLNPGSSAGGGGINVDPNPHTHEDG